MQRTPFPVDVTTSVWDFIVGTAEIVGALGAAGALLIAALAYRRQVEESIVRQAALVTVKIIVDDQSKRAAVHVQNDSDQPMLLIQFGMQGTALSQFLESPSHLHAPLTLLAHDNAVIGYFKSDAPAPRTVITFEDLGGRRWKFSDLGGISRVPTTRYQRYRYRRQMRRRGFG